MVPLEIDIPVSFFNEEILCDYKVSEEMKKIWSIELDLLSQLQKVCQKNGIRYFACGGTLLGAVRHQGFIPWDDDIDVTMLREDYEKLCSVWQEFSSPYELQFYGKTHGYFTGHAQLRNTRTTGILKNDFNCTYLIPYNRGIFIDIFPLDAVPDDAVIRSKQVRRITKLKDKAMRLYKLTEGYIAEKSHATRKISHLLHQITPIKETYQDVYANFLKECQRYNQQDTEYVSMLSFMPPNEKLWIKRKYLENCLEVPFEFMTICVEEHADEVLRQQYGDYTFFVKGGCYHGGVIFDTDVSAEQWISEHDAP